MALKKRKDRELIRDISILCSHLKENLYKIEIKVLKSLWMTSSLKEETSGNETLLNKKLHQRRSTREQRRSQKQGV